MREPGEDEEILSVHGVELGTSPDAWYIWVPDPARTEESVGDRVSLGGPSVRISVLDEIGAVEMLQSLPPFERIRFLDLLPEHLMGAELQEYLLKSGWESHLEALGKSSRLSSDGRSLYRDRLLARLGKVLALAEPQSTRSVVCALVHLEDLPGGVERSHVEQLMAYVRRGMNEFVRPASLAVLVEEASRFRNLYADDLTLLWEFLRDEMERVQRVFCYRTSRMIAAARILAHMNVPGNVLREIIEFDEETLQEELGKIAEDPTVWERKTLIEGLTRLGGAVVQMALLRSAPEGEAGAQVRRTAPVDAVGTLRFLRENASVTDSMKLEDWAAVLSVEDEQCRLSAMSLRAGMEMRKSSASEL